MKNTCSYKTQISLFMDNEQSEKKAIAFKAHLGTCAVCSQLLNEYQKTQNMLLSYPSILPDDAFDSQFESKLSEIKQGLKQREKHSFSDYLKQMVQSVGEMQFARPALVTALLCFFIITGIYYQKTTKEGLTGHYPEMPVTDLINHDLASSVAVVENLEFYDEMDVITNLELLENYQTLMSMADKL